MGSILNHSIAGQQPTSQPVQNKTIYLHDTFGVIDDVVAGLVFELIFIRMRTPCSLLNFSYLFIYSAQVAIGSKVELT